MAYKFIRQSFVATRDLDFHQTRVAFDVAKRRRKLARHEVSGQRRNKFRPERTMEINLIWRSLFRFRCPFRTGFLLPRYQTLRVWLISSCAFGTSWVRRKNWLTIREYQLVAYFSRQNRKGLCLCMTPRKTLSLGIQSV